MSKPRRIALVFLVIAAVVAGLLALPVAVGADDDDDDDDYEHALIINVVGPSPFIYGGYTYIPLRSATDFIGAVLLWDSLKGRAVITYGGKELALVVGSPTAYYLGRPVHLSVAPVIVGGRVLVPVAALQDYLAVPVTWEPNHRIVRIKGRKGWGECHVSSRPPWPGRPPWASAWATRGSRRGHEREGGVVILKPGERYRETGHKRGKHHAKHEDEDDD